MTRIYIKMFHDLEYQNNLISYSFLEFLSFDLREECRPFL